MMKKRLQWLMMPLLAALFISAAGAAEVGTEQVLLDGDQAVFTPVSVEPIEINGVPNLSKTYEMPPDFDPAALKEQPFEQDGYWYRYERMDKTVHHKTETQDAEDTVTLDAPSTDLSAVIDKFPVTKSYIKDGYIGDLTLDLQSIPVLKKKTHLPVIIDPSHAGGKWWLVEPMAKASVAAGADGLMIEVHNDPECALCDGAQSLKPEKYAALLAQIGQIAQVVGKQV